LKNEFNLNTKNEDIDVDLSNDRSFTTDFLDKELKTKLKENDKGKGKKKKSKKKGANSSGKDGNNCGLINWDHENEM